MVRTAKKKYTPAAIRVALTSEERDFLVSVETGGRPGAAKFARIIRLVGEGRTAPDVAARVGVTKARIYQAIHHFCGSGRTACRPLSARPATASGRPASTPVANPNINRLGLSEAQRDTLAAAAGGAGHEAAVARAILLYSGGVRANEAARAAGLPSANAVYQYVNRFRSAGSLPAARPRPAATAGVAAVAFGSFVSLAAPSL